MDDKNYKNDLFYSLNNINHKLAGIMLPIGQMLIN